MREEDEILKKAVLRLNANLLGTALGLGLGCGLFLASIILVLKGGPVVGPHLALLSQFFPGYTVTFLGSIVGFFYAFVTGFLIGAVLGVVYNQIARVGMAPDHLRSGEARLCNFGFIFAPGSGRSGT